MQRGWITDFWAHVDKSGDCWVWQRGRTRHGYGELWDGSKVRYAHRHSWELVNGPIPAGLLVLHRCDNPPCVNPGHLFLGTRGDNIRDAWAKGRGSKPPRTPARITKPRARLTREQVRDIKSRAAAGPINQSAIAREFGVGTTTINKIINGQRWRAL